MKTRKYSIRKTFIVYFLLTILFIPFIESMLKGIDVTDTCYLLTRYKYVFQKDVEVNSSTILFTEIIGGLFYKIFPEYQVLVLTLVSWGLNLGIAILTYRLLQNFVNKVLLIIILIAGSTYSMASFHVLHYDMLSMFFQILAFSLLIEGLDKSKREKIFLSGLFVGINIFVRLPNVLQGIFIILIFWFEGEKEKKNRKTWAYVKAFGTGLIIAVFLGLVLCLFLLSKEVAGRTLFSTLKMLTNSTSAYGTGSIITRFLASIFQGVKFAVKNEKFILIFFVSLFFLRKLYNRFADQRFYIGFKIFMLLETIFIIITAIQSGIKWLYVDTLEMLAVNFILILAAGAIYFYRKDIRVSTICLGTLFMELILTIGTNNGSYFYVVFMAFPAAVSICILWKGLGKKDGLLNIGCKYLLVAYMTSLICTSGFQFYRTYVYRDAPQELLTCEVRLKEFKGIRTSTERAAYIEKLKELLGPYEDYQLLTLGDFNVGYVITDISAILGFIWGIIIVIRKIMIPNIAMGYSSIMAVILFIGGMIMVMLGLLGEYIGRAFITINQIPQYVIKEQVMWDEGNNTGEKMGFRLESNIESNS